jgi:SAM-dependent methyltransferase
MENFWDKLMGTDEGAADYMLSYGEGPGSDTRKVIGDFINEGESVLDVGCGPGWNFEHFRDFGPHVIYKGLDYSPRFVRVANKRNPGIYEVGDARKLIQDDESWDVVLLQDILEHTNGYKDPIHEALRVARKRVIISFWHLIDGDNEHINDDGDDGWGAWYDGTEFKKFLDTLDLHWLETSTQPGANREHKFFIIDKETPHGIR